MNVVFTVIRGVVMDSPQLTSLDLYAFPFLTDDGKERMISLSPSTPQELVDLIYPNAQLHLTVHEQGDLGMLLITASRDEKSIAGGAYQLVEYNGYTVDFRLRQFRKVKFGELPEFHDFESVEGRKLMTEFKRALRHSK